MEETVERARAAFDRQAWAEAKELLLAADAQAGLGAADLERLAVATNLLGESGGNDPWERAHQAWLRDGDPARAARCAFWLGMHLMQYGQGAQANGWFSRAARLLEERQLDCVEHGYLHIPGALRSLHFGEVDAAATAFEHAARIGDRFADRDLQTLARMGLGQCLISRGDTGAGMALLDDAMVTVLSGETSPVPSGLVYCTLIVSCQQVFDLRRAQEWTAALDRWSRPQQGLVPFRGQCLVHRSEIMQLHGDWPEAFAEAQRAVRLLSTPHRHPPLGMALCQLAELHRLRGELTDADEAYRAASRSGREPQPGLALLRLAQGRVDAAAGSIRRVLDETREGSDRWRLLAAAVDIALAAADIAAARASADELAGVAAELDAQLLHASAARALGAVLLAEGDPRTACEPLRRALALWQEIDAPYEEARVRELLAAACRQLGDTDTAQLELDAAAVAFKQLGAMVDLERITGTGTAGGLTERETQVLRLAAAGKTNREIAAELVLSEHTVRRHLQNIFGKLGVTSRAGATAYAYQHDLI